MLITFDRENDINTFTDRHILIKSCSKKKEIIMTS